jgi:hypothetical protein
MWSPVAGGNPNPCALHDRRGVVLAAEPLPGGTRVWGAIRWAFIPGRWESGESIDRSMRLPAISSSINGWKSIDQWALGKHRLARMEVLSRRCESICDDDVASTIGTVCISSRRASKIFFLCKPINGKDNSNSTLLYTEIFIQFRHGRNVQTAESKIDHDHRAHMAATSQHMVTPPLPSPNHTTHHNSCCSPTLPDFYSTTTAVSLYVFIGCGSSKIHAETPDPHGFSMTSSKKKGGQTHMLFTRSASRLHHASWRSAHSQVANGLLGKEDKPLD